MSRTGGKIAGWVAVAVAFTLAAARVEPAEPEKRSIALIVNTENATRDVEFSQLRRTLRLDRRFWPDKSRVVLFLPRTDSEVKKVLNDKIYGMTEAKLRKYWTGKVFAGDIPSVPQIAKTSRAAGKLVSRTKGAISAVPADDVPPGVRVLMIDGKKPGEEGYALTYEVEASTAPR